MKIDLWKYFFVIFDASCSITTLNQDELLQITISWAKSTFVDCASVYSTSEVIVYYLAVGWGRST